MFQTISGVLMPMSRKIKIISNHVTFCKRTLSRPRVLEVEQSQIIDKFGFPQGTSVQDKPEEACSHGEWISANDGVLAKASRGSQRSRH
jgi:hypothetical protein